ncbi:MAG: sigma-70 family RNA polymerase sigma factor [Proteiniphilum sp.]|nr:sigma-70 family RNA polymerase sigma factor [Proteiniphilum sp.]
MDKFLSMTDEELVTLYAKGNNKAFEALFSKYEETLFSYIFYLVRNRDLADDIFQETFIKAITTIKRGKYTESGKFRSWISRIAHNLVVDYFRSEQKHSLISNDEYEYDLFNNSKFSDETIETSMVKNQIHSDVKRLVDALPEMQREVLNMRYYNDMSFKEIADKTGVSINTALGRMRYAILNMRRVAQENDMILS